MMITVMANIDAREVLGLQHIVLVPLAGRRHLACPCRVVFMLATWTVGNDTSATSRQAGVRRHRAYM